MLVIYNILKELNIEYEEVSHEAVYTAEEAQKIKLNITGIGCKNLFLTDKKNYYLYLIKDDKMANLKELKKEINSSHLSFASERELKEILNLEPGSVTPLGLINDTKNIVTVVIDKELKNNKLLCHPNINTKTISISYDDLIKFIKYTKHEFLIV
ncbi:MAG: prolyl-tRNA synthetase associated domain-containing protein [Ruminococcus sp.]|nr:prolyl-tRNA synthetase associated domain-containing protein [Ruminococcus sp.]